MGPRSGQMGCVVLCRNFHTAPEQDQGPTPIVPNCSGSGPCPGAGGSQCDCILGVGAALCEHTLRYKCMMTKHLLRNTSPVPLALL